MRSSALRGERPSGSVHVRVIRDDSERASIGELDAIDEAALLGQLEQHAADLAASEPQVRIDARRLELVELAEDRLGDDDLGVREREDRAGVG